MVLMMMWLLLLLVLLGSSAAAEVAPKLELLSHAISLQSSSPTLYETCTDAKT